MEIKSPSPEKSPMKTKTELCQIKYQEENQEELHLTFFCFSLSCIIVYHHYKFHDVHYCELEARCCSWWPSSTNSI